MYPRASSLALQTQLSSGVRVIGVVFVVVSDQICSKFLLFWINRARCSFTVQTFRSALISVNGCVSDCGFSNAEPTNSFGSLNRKKGGECGSSAGNV